MMHQGWRFQKVEVISCQSFLFIFLFPEFLTDDSRADSLPSSAVIFCTERNTVNNTFISREQLISLRLSFQIHISFNPESLILTNMLVVNHSVFFLTNDEVDERNSSSKNDKIVTLPYVVHIKT